MENEEATEFTKTIQSLLERVALLELVVGKIAQRNNVSVPSQLPAQNVATKQVIASTPVKPKTSTEIEVGQKWLSIVGIVLVFLAALFFVQFVFQFVGPVGKVLLSYLGAGVLFGFAAFTKKKYPQFSGVIGAGAWGITYLVTYALYFFPATRIVTSTPIELLLLTIVVMTLIGLALFQKSRTFVAVGLVLGFLTMILSPLSLFSIIGTVLLLGILVVIAVVLPWGDLILPATIGSYTSYLFWFSNVLGRLPAQGGGLLEKEMIGLIALVVIWIFVAVGLLLRRDKEKAMGSQADALSLILATVGTTGLGLLALHDLTLILTTPRLARAIWLLLLTGLTVGWSFIAHEYRNKQSAITAGSFISILLLIGSIAYFLPNQSSVTSLAWAGLGLATVTLSVFMKTSRLSAVGALPLIASALRFVTLDMQKNAAPLGTSHFTINLLLGIVIALVVTGSAAMIKATYFTTPNHNRSKRLPGLLLVTGLIVFYTMTAQEFSGAVPSVLWGLAGLATIVAGFLAHWKNARVIGLIALAVIVARVFIYDLGDLEPLPRVISFSILGGLLLLIGYGYNQNKEKLQKYLLEED